VTSSDSQSPGTVRAPENHTDGAPVKADIREFYDDISRRLAQSRVGNAVVFLNYGYVSLGAGDESQLDHSRSYLDPTSIRLVCELVGAVDLRERRVLDVGCGRGGAVALLADRFGAEVTGIDLAPEAIAFCRRKHRQPNVRFEAGDAENLPVETESFDAVTNIESSHIYPNLPGFYAEVRRALKAGGVFLYTGVLSVRGWAETRAELASLGLEPFSDRNITPNVLASCDAVAARHAKAHGVRDSRFDNLLAVPGSDVYEQMRSGTWEYRILRARRR
jgi:phthiocerol/phenolphthiocerol synthesis type-I polyketide synthase E